MTREGHACAVTAQNLADTHGTHPARGESSEAAGRVSVLQPSPQLGAPPTPPTRWVWPSSRPTAPGTSGRLLPDSSPLEGTGCSYPPTYPSEAASDWRTPGALSARPRPRLPLLPHNAPATWHGPAGPSNLRTHSPRRPSAPRYSSSSQQVPSHCGLCSPKTSPCTRPRTRGLKKQITV